MRRRWPKILKLGNVYVGILKPINLAGKAVATVQIATATLYGGVTSTEGNICAGKATLYGGVTSTEGNICAGKATLYGGIVVSTLGSPV